MRYFIFLITFLVTFLFTNPITYTITVKDTFDYPLRNAVVNLAGVEKITDDNGTAVLSVDPTSVDISNELPKNFFLNPNNYPNPVIDKTSIDFSNPKSADFSFVIYNILGQRVYGKSYLSEPGFHQLNLDGLDRLAPGVYIAAFESDDFSAALKFVKSGFGNKNINQFSSDNITAQLTPQTKGINRNNSLKKATGFNLIIERDGFTGYEDDISIASQDTSFTVQLNADGSYKHLGGYIVDNHTYEKVEGIVEIQGEEYKTIDDYFSAWVPTTLLSELKTWHTMNGDPDGFVKTYKNVDLSASIHNAGLYVTTYDDLVHGIADSLALSPEDFKQLAAEATTGQVYLNIRSPDLAHAQDLKLWIDKDFGEREFSEYGVKSFSEDDQQWVKSVAEDYFLSHFIEDNHKIPIYVAQSGEDIPLNEESDIAFSPAKGYFAVISDPGPGGYKVTIFDYDNDGVLDAGRISIGLHSADRSDLRDLEGAIEEISSIIAPNGVYNEALIGKTAFHQIVQGKDVIYLTPGDKKLMHLQENMYDVANKSLTPVFEYELGDGTAIMRFYDHPGAHIDDILGLHQ